MMVLTTVQFRTTGTSGRSNLRVFLRSFRWTQKPKITYTFPLYQHFKLNLTCRQILPFSHKKTWISKLVILWLNGPIRDRLQAADIITRGEDGGCCRDGKKNNKDLIYQTLERCLQREGRAHSKLENSEPQSLRAFRRFRLQLKDGDTKRDNRAIDTRHWQR